MNTFRRNDLLQKSVSHYVTCTCVKEIQIVWSDQKNKPSTNLFGEAVGNDKIKYEIHDKDSLNNRFLPELSIPTQVCNYNSRTEKIFLLYWTI